VVPFVSSRWAPGGPSLVLTGCPTRAAGSSPPVNHGVSPTPVAAPSAHGDPGCHPGRRLRPPRRLSNGQTADATGHGLPRNSVSTPENPRAIARSPSSDTPVPIPIGAKCPSISARLSTTIIFLSINVPHRMMGTGNNTAETRVIAIFSTADRPMNRGCSSRFLWRATAPLAGSLRLSSLEREKRGTRPGMLSTRRVTTESPPSPRPSVRHAGDPVTPSSPPADLASLV